MVAVELACPRCYQISPEEQKFILEAFANPQQAREHGVKLAGQKYFTLQADDEHLYGKKGVRIFTFCSCYSAYTRQATDYRFLTVIAT